MANEFYTPSSAPSWFITPHAHAIEMKEASEKAKVNKAEEEAKKAEDGEWKEVRKGWEAWRKEGSGVGGGPGGFWGNHSEGGGYGMRGMQLDDYWIGGGGVMMYPSILYPSQSVINITTSAPAPITSLPPMGNPSWTFQRAIWPHPETSPTAPAQIRAAYAIPAELVPTWRVLRHLVGVRAAEGREEVGFSKAMEWAIADMGRV